MKDEGDVLYRIILHLHPLSFIMDRRITIALVVVLVLLGGYIWLTFLRPDAPPLNPATPEPTLEVFFRLDENDVRAVQVRDLKNNQLTRVVREGELWRMEQPAQGEANPIPISRLLFTLSRMEADRRLTNAGDLASYGLNPPQYQADVEMQDGTVMTLAIGNANPDGDYKYMHKGGDATVYLVDALTGADVIDFVKKPPYTPTPTPTAEPTRTPQPTAAP
jgi:hypothetical protein